MIYHKIIIVKILICWLGFYGRSPCFCKGRAFQGSADLRGSILPLRSRTARKLAALTIPNAGKHFTHNKDKFSSVKGELIFGYLINYIF